MWSHYFVLISIFVLGVSCRHLKNRQNYIVDSSNIMRDDIEDFLLESQQPFQLRRLIMEPSEKFEKGLTTHILSVDRRGLDKLLEAQDQSSPEEEVVEANDESSDADLPHPARLRIARQVQGSANTNPDGTFNLNGKMPLLGNDKNVLSAVGSANGLKPGGSFGAAGGGLAWDNINGHGASLTGTNIPSLGNQLTAAGRLNLVNTPDHNLNANAFVSRTMPTIPNVPNFNTAGGSLDYAFRNKVGASVAMSHTPQFQKTDYSAMGNLNLFKNPSSSLDMNAGFSKSVSPFMPNRGWQPSGGVSYTRYF